MRFRTSAVAILSTLGVISRVLSVSAVSLEAVVKETEQPLYRGPRLYERMAGLNKVELMAGRKHVNLWVREISLLHLKKTHGDELAQADLREISESLSDPVTRVRVAAADLLGGVVPAGRKLLEEALSTTSSRQKVSAAIGMLKNSTNYTAERQNEALQVLLNCLGQCDPDLEALNYLINHRHPEALPWLKEKIFDNATPENAARWAADVYSHTATAEDVPTLLLMLKSSNINVRFAAIRRLREFPGEDVTRNVLRLTNEPNDNLRHWVFLYLGESKSDSVIPSLLRGLDDKSGDVVLASIEGLKKMKTARAVPHLVKLLIPQDASGSLTRPQVNAGNAIATLTGETFTFGYGMMCHHAAMVAGEKTRAGKSIGGEAGKRMVEEGEREAADFKTRVDKFVLETDRKNSNERKRLLAWWENGGKSDFGD